MDNQNAKKKFREFLGTLTAQGTDANFLRIAFACREYALREAIAVIPKRPEQDGTDSKAHFVAGFNQCRYETDENITNLI